MPIAMLYRAAQVLAGVVLLLAIAVLPGQAQIWNPNVDDETYKNPIIHADYSDPDVVKKGDDFYMTSSSFNALPALPILHSKDLVNWRLINHAVPDLPDRFDVPQHGNGVWAPSFNYHDGEFYIFWGDPDAGIFMVKTDDPRGEWEDPVLVQEAKGWIDPAPLWDDDGNAYLVHAFANSRAGINSVLHVAPMDPDGTHLVGRSQKVYDGHGEHPTIEGPKFYKRNGDYYIFAPAGGVRDGWQTVLRADSVYGEYEIRTVLEQGETEINGPHQGAWVHLDSGEDWFIHFQEHIAYGRIVHMQPMWWENGWPVMGRDPDDDGTGIPVLEHEKPDVDADPPTMVPQTSDDFEDARLGLQWQWHANSHPGWYSLTDRVGTLTLFSQPMPEGAENMWPVPNLLLQKFPAPAFTATTKMSFNGEADGERAGLIVMGEDYAHVSVRHTADGYELIHTRKMDAHEGGAPQEPVTVSLDDAQDVHLQARVQDGAEVQFAYSLDGGDSFDTIGEPFQAVQGQWIGAKVGVYALTPENASESGYADFEFFNVE
jgi:beta-xylosidase